ncbi:MAG TPA: hypothetical protein VEZ55_06180 [Chitinophagaceae bacterium]|nr:hypothetical protein [Chitinophagaceae bacterium]
MKQTLIAAIVGGIILFIWQFLSWSLINLHQGVQQYTSKQDEIMNFLNNQQLPEGGYILPTVTENASMDEWNEMMKKAEGKPWASIQYHKALKTNMGLNMIRGLIIDILTVWLFCWILARLQLPSFTTIVITSLLTGLIIFFNVPYTNFIWYENFDIWAHLLDAIVSWGLCGLWLAWWFSRQNRQRSAT